jgi:hypothetical protein
MLSWSKFEELSGGPQHNFEMLWRSAIRLRYGRYGLLAGLANQPGVEFHLHLHKDCDLGTKGQWFGWQCRWFDLPSNRRMTTIQRNKIEDAIRKTVKHLPGLTDWILCTKHPLAKRDQDWFLGLKRALSLKMRLDARHSGDIDALLTGDAEILRKTYFGELVLNPTALADQHALSVARIRKRWLPEAHQTVHAERALRRMLGEAASWDDLTSVAIRLSAATGVIEKEPRTKTGPLTSATTAFVNVARALADSMQEVHRLLEKGDLELLRQQLDARLRTLDSRIVAVPRQLRSARLACGLYATNALADLRLGIQLLDEVDSFLGVTLVGVLADAGGGKTQLAAQLTAALRDRPAGILLHGRNLHSGAMLDDLAKSITIQGNPVTSMEALLAALDAAGQRARRRLPLVIDGLNEAEDPREWKAPLATLGVLLRRFANVLVVCTVRTGARRATERDWPPQQPEETPARMDFAKQALPDDIIQIEMPGFGGDTAEGIQKYFRHFRINPGDAELPFELLSHPLTLRIFCEVTNPERKREVSIEAMPGSLTGLFERYLEFAIERIGELAPNKQRYYEHDIRRVLDRVGNALWEGRTRELREQDLRSAIADDARPWNESIVHMLEQEGVILLMPGDSPGERNIVAVYDALGGYLTASAILAKYGHSGLEQWLKDPKTLTALSGSVADCHPLALDIFGSLVGLVPRRLHHQQLWQMLDDPLRTVALRIAATLEGSYLDAATVTALGDHIRQAQQGSDRLLLRLLRTRGAVGHPLNAEFFDDVLGSMPVGDRDLHWTEWVRRNYADKWGHERVLDIAEDIQQLETRWQNTLSTRTSSERLRAKWLSWMLTTTVQNLRDRVTRALYWFGRGDPAALFELAEGASKINDPYVFERLLAASYGVAMAAHCDSRQPDFRKTTLPEHARRIFDLMFKSNAPGRTTHILTREYAQRFLELAQFHNRKLFSKAELALIRPPFSDGGRVQWQELATSEEEVHGADSPFRMDFENYTLGRLVKGRGNYDFKHAGYRKVRSQVLWRVQQLGWTAQRFGQVDRVIESNRYNYGQVVDEHHKVDRYGKKYSWIAYFELGGWLQDQELLERRADYGRTWDVDIDPSFPSPTPEHKLILHDFLGDPRLSLVEWINKGPTPDVARYFHQPSILSEQGPWVMLDGFLTREDESRGRRLFAFVRSFLVAKNEAKAFEQHLAKQSLGGRWLPEKPAVIYTFAGEMPWCTTFPNSGAAEMRFEIAERKVRVRRKQPFFLLDGKVVNLTSMDLMRFRVFGIDPGITAGSNTLTEKELDRVVRRDRIVEVEEVHKDLRKFRAFIPVVDFRWEGRNVEGLPIHGAGLAKQLALSAGLVHLPQTHDLQTKDGIRATYGIAFQRQNFHNSEQFFFIRENILRDLLRERACGLVWAVWGERELSYKQLERARSVHNSVEPSYANFQAIYHL